MIEVFIITALKDNYIYLIHESTTNKTAVVDPSEAEPVLATLKKKQWTLDYIWNTHHHWDHTDGNLLLKKKTNATIVGSEKDAHRIPGIDIKLSESTEFIFGNTIVKVIETPGHTSGALCWWLKKDGILFTGDTLFSLGCGRLFEGTAEQMWDSICKIRRLPKETKIYCGHEYTLMNCNFALSLDPHNQQLQEKIIKIKGLRRKNQATIPVTLGEELQSNPFLRADDKQFKASLQLKSASASQVFAKLRKLKDNYS